MSPIRLDFHRVDRPTPWIGLILVTLGVIALLWVLAQQDILAQQRTQVETQEAELKWRKQQLVLRQQEVQKETPVNEKVAIIRRAQQQSALPTLKLLEASWSRNVAFLRLELNTTEHSVKLEMESRTPADLLEWMDIIHHQTGVARVALARQQIKLADPFKPTQAGVEIYLRKDQTTNPQTNPPRPEAP